MRIYAITVFLSAFLLFLIQPLIASLSLPWFGGTAAVWATCVVFFQLVLLLGYLYAHGLKSLPLSVQRYVHPFLLLLSLTVVPIAMSSSWKPEGSSEPLFLLLGLLVTTVGLPYFLLSTTSPLVQTKYALNFPGKTPYRLFALSNIGSMLALLSYPILVEPFVPLRMQVLGWSVIYVIFILLCGFLIWSKSQEVQNSSSDSNGHSLLMEKIPGKTKLLWFVFASCPSVLLLVITNFLTEDIAPIPFLWILPLVLYLLSFILCFDGKGWYKRGLYIPLTLAGLTFTLSIISFPLPLWLMIGFPAITLFAACMVCHGELVNLKPATHSLTSFYLIISFGGVVGGAFVALIAPYLFNYRYELYLGLFFMLCLLGALSHLYPVELSRLLPKKPLIFFFVIFILVAGYRLYVPINSSLLMARNFYGVLRVEDRGGKNPIRVLHHGKINHGFQYSAQERRLWPTSYFGPDSGGGLVLRERVKSSAQKVGIVGLGIGTLIAYAKEGDYYRLYEINPLVVDIAKQHFTFLHETKAKTDIVLGDGRLSLEKESRQNFDVLIVDAFSGDAIPRHLLTAEAFAVYFRHLKPDGILAFHVSNSYLELAPVVKLAANHFKKQAEVVYSDGVSEKGTNASEWVLVGESSLFKVPAIRAVAKPISVGDLEMWTDDSSSLYRVLKF